MKREEMIERLLSLVCSWDLDTLIEYVCDTERTRLEALSDELVQEEYNFNSDLFDDEVTND